MSGLAEPIALHTARTRMRPLEDRDAGAIAAIRGDLAAARMAGDVPHPYSLETAQGWIAIVTARRLSGRCFAFVIENDSDGVVGDISVFKRGGDEDWELGYAVAKAYRRRGYAREALGAALPWARDALGVRMLKAGCFEDNAASIALLESCGFRLNGTTTTVYSLARNAKVRCRYLDRDLEAAA